MALENVYIVGTGMIRFGKYLEKTIKELTAEAVIPAIKNAGITIKDIQSVWFSNSLWGYFSEQHAIRGEVALRPLGIEGIPIINVENACAGGSTALHCAWMSVASGIYDCVMAVGVEKLYDENKEKSFKAFWAGIDVSDVKSWMEKWRKAVQKVNFEVPEKFKTDDKAGNKRSAFMDLYASWCRWHMAKYGTTQKQLAIIASKNHFHSSLNPFSQFQKPMSVEEILSSRMVVYPLTVPMCAPIGDGAACAIVCSEKYLKKLKNPRPVKILASVSGSGTSRDIEDEENDIAVRLSRKAYEIAGVGPEDIDVAEVHDATAFGELHQTEALGFCKPGEGGIFAESGATKLGGKIPINSSGGLESRGHPIGASGLAQVFEIVSQLRGEADKRQVENCRIGLVENGGGNLDYEEAAMCIHIIERVIK